jgi:hypothetical protein
MYLKFVNRSAKIPGRESMTLECDSYTQRIRVVEVGESLDSVVNIHTTYWPFEILATSGGPYRTRKVEERTSVLIVEVYGAAGFEHIASNDVIMFVMNDNGETIDKTLI